MTKTALPTSRAKTAYGLLSEIRRLILAEPKRYNQKRYLERVDANSPWIDAGVLSASDAAPCGTRACVAGWVVTLQHGADATYLSAAVDAQEILGLDCDAADALFAGHAAGTTTPGTKAHAKAGAAHIARFQKQHAAQLKATRV